MNGFSTAAARFKHQLLDMSLPSSKCTRRLSGSLVVPSSLCRHAKRAKLYVNGSLLFELERRLDLNFPIQVVGQLGDQVKTADHIALQKNAM